MATIDIYDLSGKTVGTLELADEVFGAIHEDLLWEAVKHYRAGQRAGQLGAGESFTCAPAGGQYSDPNPSTSPGRPA